LHGIRDCVRLGDEAHRVGVKISSTKGGHAVDPKMIGYSQVSLSCYISLPFKMATTHEYKGLFREDACYAMRCDATVETCETFHPFCRTYFLLHKILLVCVLHYAQDYAQHEIKHTWFLDACHTCPHSRCFPPFHAAPSYCRISSIDAVAQSNISEAKMMEELNAVEQLWNGTNHPTPHCLYLPQKQPSYQEIHTAQQR